MSNQPNWKLVAQLGDVHPLEHGGVFVYVDETGVYAPEVAHLDCPEDDGGKWIEHRYILEPCTFIDGVLSDNKFHPDHPAWFADSIGSIASFTGETVEGLIEALCGQDAIERALAWEAIGSYHGLVNLDQYPNEFTREEIEARYPHETWKV